MRIDSFAAIMRWYGPKKKNQWSFDTSHCSSYERQNKSVLFAHNQET